MAAAGATISPCAAQTSTAPLPVGRQATPAKPASKGSGSQVIFSRSTDENGETTTQTPPSAAQPTFQMVNAPSAEDADRQAVTFTDFDMDVRLRPAAQHLAVRGPGHRAQRRQDPAGPHSAANFLLAQLGADSRLRQGRDRSRWPRSTPTPTTPASCTRRRCPLAQPLAPGASIQLDVTYSGAIAASAQRLLAIGTPDDVALHSDWDQIGVAFHRPARLWQRGLVSGLQRSRHPGRRRAPL